MNIDSCSTASLEPPARQCFRVGKERRSFAICPKDDLPSCVKKRPTFAALSFCFLPKEDDQKRSELAYILLLEKRLSQQGLYLKLLNSCISKKIPAAIANGHISNPSAKDFFCPKNLVYRQTPRRGMNAPIIVWNTAAYTPLK